VGSFDSLAHAAGALIAIVAYFAAMLLHEWGHVVLARRHLCAVYGIDLYPLVGITRLEMPRTRFAQCAIAWGGLLFQAVVGIPIFLWIKLVGYTPLEVVNAFLGVFSFLTVVMLVLNILPIPPLDGALAWGIVPLLLRRARNSNMRPSRGQR
jgi:stage IV sporulation protein FB